MASVLSFAVQIESINATDANGKTVSLLRRTPTVDFARLNGLETLLDMNECRGNVRQCIITLAQQPSGICRLDGSAPAIATKPATYRSVTYTPGLLGERLSWRKAVHRLACTSISNLASPSAWTRTAILPELLLPRSI